MANRNPSRRPGGGSSRPRTAPPPARRDAPVATRPDPGGSVPLWVRLAAEAFGTFVLVLGGCGSAVLASTFLNRGVQLGIGFVGIALAFGLTVLAMAVAVGGVSGGHFNPAVTLGLACAGRFKWRDLPGYVVAQLVGAIVAATILFVIASGRSGFDATATGFASNGFGTRSPGGFSIGAVILTEVVLTAVFLAVIIAATGSDAPKALAPVVIGLTLTLIHLVSIPVDNTSVNPARSLGVALFAGPAALGQLWVFLVAPAVGGAIAGTIFRFVTGGQRGLGGEGGVPAR